MPFFMEAPVEQLKVQPIVDVRLRYERRIDRDFFDTRPDNRSDLLTRVRAGATWQYGPNWSGALEFQYAHSLSWTAASNFSGENRDLSLAFAQYAENGIKLSFGREKIVLGDERLIGALEWGNVARRFDVVRYQDATLDAWIGQVGVQSPRPKDVLLGVASLKHGAGTTSMIYKHDETAGGDTDSFTLDHVVKGKALGLDWDVEAAGQLGHTGGRDLEAWALHFGFSKQLSSKTRVFAEVNAASGGGDSDQSRTFDNLYPTNHKFYGSADLHAWKNMNELALGVEHKASDNLNLKTVWHDFSLRDPSDAWYGAGGGPNRGPNGAFTDPTGAAGRDTGWEVDLEAAYKIDARNSLTAGIAVYAPGRFVETLNGGKADRQVWGYVAWQTRL